ncbi:jg14453 [Pararge aegeria aegeria]|uniref:Jg14453 protein n=1 Tax=Pararge aegeria aegeria TaxID=348720 RepID=A0A8S4QF95_9NEOP|nr:jg14453 [Pararge aegeria aegeria]
MSAYPRSSGTGQELLFWLPQVQAYCNIIAGACFTLGLRFAGSGDDDARDAVLHFVSLFLRLSGRGVAELAGGSTFEACTCVCLLAAGMYFLVTDQPLTRLTCFRSTVDWSQLSSVTDHGGERRHPSPARV